MASTTFSGPVTSTNGFIGAVTGNVTGNVTLPVATVAAAGSAQGDAGALSSGFNYVTGADDVKGVRLPAAVAGTVVIIKVGPGADLKVYPATGDKINDGSANAALTVVDDVCFMVIARDATDWYTLPLLPS
jgi:uncharacterized membrane protein